MDFCCENELYYENEDHFLISGFSLTLVFKQRQWTSREEVIVRLFGAEGGGVESDGRADHPKRSGVIPILSYGVDARMKLVVDLAFLQLCRRLYILFLCGTNCFSFFFSLSFVGFGQIEGIAYDWTAKNIYWTDQGKKIIGVGRQDGSYQKILLTVGLSKPRAIVVHPSMG